MFGVVALELRLAREVWKAIVPVTMLVLGLNLGKDSSDKPYKRWETSISPFPRGSPWPMMPAGSKAITSAAAIVLEWYLSESNSK